MPTSLTEKPALDKAPEIPTPLARRWVRYVVGFGVGTVVGLAPFLGVLDVPLFKPLLHLYPVTLQNRLIPLSAAVMGLTAVAIQWYGAERVSQQWLRKWFVGALVCFLVSLTGLLIVRAMVVVDVPIQGGQAQVAFVTGLTRLATCACAQPSDALCISETLTFNPAQIEGCWGSRPVRLAELVLQLNYLVLVGSFGVATGLVVLREAGGEARTRRTRTRRRREREIEGGGRE